MSLDLSDHALERWYQRSAAPALDPLVAWEIGAVVDGLEYDGDEVRYHRQSETLLIRCDTVISTIIDASDVTRWRRQQIAETVGGVEG